MGGVSGDEERVARRIAREIEPYCDELYIDKTGNLIAFKKGRKVQKKHSASPILFNRKEFAK